MPSKNKYWHKAWDWAAPGVARHECGLHVTAAGAPAGAVAQAMASVLPATQHASARGVLPVQMPAHIAALRREGRRWLQDPRNRPRQPAAHTAASAAKV